VFGRALRFAAATRQGKVTLISGGDDGGLTSGRKDLCRSHLEIPLLFLGELFQQADLKSRSIKTYHTGSNQDSIIGDKK
jgi:hypothetical protein